LRFGIKNIDITDTSKNEEILYSVNKVLLSNDEKETHYFQSNCYVQLNSTNNQCLELKLYLKSCHVIFQEFQPPVSVFDFITYTYMEQITYN